MKIIVNGADIPFIACHIKPTIAIDNEVFYGSYTLSQRCGKFGTQATMDETYLM